ncbi:hypothetical protein BH23ACI1_BH23ACI1_20680 [soil metagenome]
MNMMNTLRALAVIALASVAAASCSTARAAAPVERPALHVPPVPPRIVEPVALPAPPAPAPDPVADLPPPAAGARSKPVAPPSKPDPKAEVQPEPATPPPPAQPAVPPLRTPGTPDAREATRRIVEISARAQAILNITDYQALNPERKAHYQHTQLLISQADDAIKAANFEFARNLAEKAERLAKELQSR